MFIGSLLDKSIRWPIKYDDEFELILDMFTIPKTDPKLQEYLTYVGYYNFRAEFSAMVLIDLPVVCVSRFESVR